MALVSDARAAVSGTRITHTPPSPAVLSENRLVELAKKSVWDATCKGHGAAHNTHVWQARKSVSSLTLPSFIRPCCAAASLCPHVEEQPGAEGEVQPVHDACSTTQHSPA
jgi:hypothetical protein